MNAETQQITPLQEQTPSLDLREPGTNHQLVPVQPAAVIPSPLNELVPNPPVQRRPRLGKIARLPKLHRDMVSRMLRNNCSYGSIVGALDELGITVTERNVSNWKTRGGYQHWCFEQDRAAEMRLHQDNLLQYFRKDDASQLPEVGLQLAASHLSRYLLQPEALQQLVATPEKYARLIAALCRVAGQIHTFQKYRDDSAKALGSKHDPERIRRQAQQEIEETRQAYSSIIPQKSSEPSLPHRNFLPATSELEVPIEPPQLDSKHRQLDSLDEAAELMSMFNQKLNADQNGPTGTAR
jgi:hypothetical protein